MVNKDVVCLLILPHRVFQNLYLAVDIRHAVERKDLLGVMLRCFVHLKGLLQTRQSPLMLPKTAQHRAKIGQIGSHAQAIMALPIEGQGSFIMGKRFGILPLVPAEKS